MDTEIDRLHAWEEYRTKMASQLGVLDLSEEQIKAVISISVSVGNEMARDIRAAEPRIKKAVGVGCVVCWLTGHGDDPRSAVSHSQGFQTVEEAMQKYEEVKKDPDIWGARVTANLAVMDRTIGYYLLEPATGVPERLQQQVEAEEAC